MSTTAQRVIEGMAAVGIDQQQLAADLGAAQSTISKIVSGKTRNSRLMPRIAVRLGLPVAYLLGESDDAKTGATPPSPSASSRHVLMQVELPPEPALEAMFRGLIRSMPGVTGDELAHELAKLLPIGLQQLQGPLRYVPLDHDDMQPAPTEDRDGARRGQRQASNK